MRLLLGLLLSLYQPRVVDSDGLRHMRQHGKDKHKGKRRSREDHKASQGDPHEQRDAIAAVDSLDPAADAESLGNAERVSSKRSSSKRLHDREIVDDRSAGYFGAAAAARFQQRLLNQSMRLSFKDNPGGDLATFPMPPPLPGLDARVPLFVKFHKTGSGTAANVFRRHCADTIRSQSQFNGAFPWRGGPYCGPMPHEHASIVTYRTKGVAGFEKCLFQLAPIQLYTVLRNPVEKWWSGVYFWKKEVAKNAGGASVQNKLDSDPALLTVDDINALAAAVNWYGRVTAKGACNKGNCFSARPGPLLQFHAVLGRIDLNDPVVRDHPTPEQVESACNHLAQDFRVGIAEAMDSFAVLVALDQGWPLETMCLENFHYNAKRPRGEALRQQLMPEVQARLDELLAPDRHIYECALKQHASHVAEHDSGSGGSGIHSRALKHFQSDAFQGSCMARQKAHKDALGRRRRDDRDKGRPKSLTGGGVVMLTEEESSRAGAAGSKSSSSDVQEDGDGSEDEVEVFGSSGRCLMSKFPPSLEA